MSLKYNLMVVALLLISATTGSCY